MMKTSPPVETRADQSEPSVLTVLDVLALPLLSGARLLTSTDVAARQRVRGVSVQELPVEDFVRPGEFVMTTGMGLKRDRHRFAELVRQLAQARAACVAFAIGEYVAKVPSSVVEAAEQTGLPLVELPWELRFSEITETVLGRILDQQNSLLAQSESAHYVLDGVILNGGDLDAVCRVVSEMIGRTVSIVDCWGERVTDAPNQGDPTRPMISVPIAAGSVDLGTLFVSSTPAAISPLDLRIAQHGATAAALLMTMKRGAVAAAAHGHHNFWRRVLGGLIEPPDAIGRQAEALGIDPAVSYDVAYFAIDCPSIADTNRISELGAWALDRALTLRQTKAFHIWFKQEVAIIEPSAPLAFRAHTNYLLSDLTALIQRQHPTATVTGGLGKRGVGILEVAESYHDAMTACRLGRLLHGPGSMTDYADLGVYPTLVEAQVGGRGLGDLEERYLNPLLDYQQRTGLPLIETITSLFDCNGNVSATARALGLNRQSLLYRLDKIQSLGRVDLSSANDRFALELAVRSLRVRNIPIAETSDDQAGRS
jgi:PucR family transcriptional regulator, purine catabolism regulatory protein